MTTDTRTGWDLVTAAQAGDTDAFAELWRRYQVNVARYIASCVHHRATTEDLTSETFLRAWRNLHSVRDQGRGPDAWLIRIARNIVIDWSRRTHTQLSHPVAEIYETYLPHTDGPDVTVPEQRCHADATDRLRRMLSELPAGQQAAVRYRFFDRLPAADAAALMGCRVGALRSLQQRGVRALELKARPARSSVEFVDGVTG